VQQQTFKPTRAMIHAAERLFTAMAYVALIQPIVIAYKSSILAKGQWHIRAEYCEHLGQGAITDPGQAYLMSDEHFAEYDARCKAARKVSGLYVKHDDECPLLAAETNVIQAEHALIDEFRSVTNLTAQQMICAGFVQYKEFVDLTLRLMAPFCGTSLVILSRSI